MPFYIGGLSDGRHTVRVFLANGLGESIKDNSAFAVLQFFVKNKKADMLNFNVPLLLYNEPVGVFRGSKKDRVLLDFIVKNVVLSNDGYKVVYSIDGVKRILISASPLYLTGLNKGPHKIVLELIDKNSILAEGYFTRTEREIIVE